MSADIIDEDSLLLLLRDAIVQHSPLKDLKLILRYLRYLFSRETIFINIVFQL
jgi:hypothetical protein